MYRLCCRRLICILKRQLTVCLLQPDDSVNIAVEKINSLLETFLGISDTELGKLIKNLQPVVTNIFRGVIGRQHTACGDTVMSVFVA